MRELVEDIAKALVDKPDEVVVNVTEDKGVTVLKLTVAEDDMGKVIGKQGRIAKAIRTVVRSVANKEKIKVTLEII
ncbi:KH domain-containing protein [Clostridioides mangenotii]|uniref:KH domain-containing protein n=1 Tax=Metaclostridioides mangenotii TaxID=1540 RepID=UPI001C118C62|nr:KH domain-containing protein [Clostridioides mangenotii]MBU5306582.1 KH domain-containing protein [Clostridioides mangenotii]MCR1953752.1 KH domain-containing protein [Clostridioides mangenotii]